MILVPLLFAIVAYSAILAALTTCLKHGGNDIVEESVNL